MQVDLVRALPSDASTLAQLVQYYIYDLSELVSKDVGEDGRYAFRSLDAYWTEAWRHPYLVRVAGHHGGFALVHQRSRITGDEKTWDIAEFFVMRKYRRLGVGKTIAIRIFDMFRGDWEVRQLRANTEAILFWRRTISAYTHGQFKETLMDDERWRGPVQSFHNG